MNIIKRKEILTREEKGRRGHDTGTEMTKERGEICRSTTGCFL